MNKNIKIGILMAGSATEVAWARKSARNVFNVLKKQGFNDVIVIKPNRIFTLIPKCDIVFISVFGKPWQSGMAQCICEHFNVPYTGSDPNVSFLAFNKHIAKKIFDRRKIPTPLWKYSDKNFISWNSITKKMGKSIIIKPVDEGLSKNVFLIKNIKDYKEAYHKVMRENRKVLIEKFIKGKEITVPVIRGKDTVILPPIEISKKGEIVDYITLTRSKISIYHQLLIARKYINQIKNIARKCFVELNCKGVGYVDMIIDEKFKPYVLEVGTIAGYTQRSKVPYSASLKNISLEQLIELNFLIAFNKNFDIKKYLKNAF